MPYHFNPFTKKLDYSEHTKDVTTTGLVLAMNFNPETLIGTAGSEVVLDSSGCNNHGQNYGATSLPTGGFNGGGALDFVATENDYIDIPHSASLNFEKTNPFTITFWSKSPSETVAAGGALRKLQNDNVALAGYVIVLRPADNWIDVALQAPTNTARIYKRVDASGVIFVNWNFFTITYDGNQEPTGIKVFVNNNELTSIYTENTDTGSMQNTGNMKIGRGFGSYTEGTMDEICIYNRVLSIDEIKQLYFQRKEIHNSFISQKNMYAVCVSTQFDKTADTTLANISGLSVNLVAGKRYKFTVNLFVNANATGGHKYAMSGTVTAISIIYQINSISNTTNLNVINSRQTALDGSAGQTGATIIHTVIEGLITVNTAGTLTCQFAQNAANGTSSVLVGSNMIVKQIL